MAGSLQLLVVLVIAGMLPGTGLAQPVWVVEPGVVGPDAPPEGRSLFDHLTIRDGRQQVPFPFPALLEHLGRRIDPAGAYLDRPIKMALVPMGRSLQREAAAPLYFQSPRVVLAVDAEPAVTSQDTGMLLRDRLFIGYLEAAGVLEIISYNEAAARFEFQVVRDYRPGGHPQVIYARRVVCMGCHQNAAPIFARPLWDETNANAKVAAQLQMAKPEFFGLPARTGVDVAYAIDNATDRANEFTLTMKLWEQGCGSGDAGEACRAMLLSRVLQHALSGGRGFDTTDPEYRTSLRQHLHVQRGLHWPDGLLLPDPDIPNRRPLAGFDAQAAGEKPMLEAALREAANVPSEFEPLVPRPPKASWNPDTDAWVLRAVTGLAQFLAQADIERIDRRLALGQAEESYDDAACTAVRSRRDSSERVKLQCRGPSVSLSGLIYLNDGDGKLSGRLRDVIVRDERLGDLSVIGQGDPSGPLHITLTRDGSRTRVRLSNGDALGRLVLRRDDIPTGRMSLRVPIRHESRLLTDAVQTMRTSPNGSLAAGPFRRAEVLAGLMDAMGLSGLKWCCFQAIESPPPRLESPEAPLESPLLAPFNQVCATCHRSSEPFPPNFLSGTPDQVLRAIAQCGPRIQFRLAMWDIEPQRRQKSPMPPLSGGAVATNRLVEWKTQTLPRLRKALADISAAAEKPLPPREQAIARPYFDLPQCLPVI